MCLGVYYIFSVLCVEMFTRAKTSKLTTLQLTNMWEIDIHWLKESETMQIF